MVDIIDQDDHVIGTAPRSKAHSEGLLHRVVHFTLIDMNTKSVVLATRSVSKVTNIGMAVFLGEHMHSGESYIDGCRRGVEEELGFAPKKLVELGTHIFNDSGIIELAKFFLVYWDEDKIVCDEKEVEDLWWVKIDDLEKTENIGPITQYWIENTNWNEIVAAV